jgi:hypothetical protein
VPVKVLIERIVAEAEETIRRSAAQIRPLSNAQSGGASSSG